MAATPLDGTFNGSYSCPTFQGATNVVLNFTVTGNQAKLIEVIYDSIDSKYKFGSSVVEYNGYFAAKTLKFVVYNVQTVGQEPSGWSYSPGYNGTVSADGSQVTFVRDKATANCSDVVAKRVSATSALKE